MNLTELSKITKTGKKRIGRGHGSGRGKTAGRGTKGQLARHNPKLDFDGDANPLIRRLPFLRGKGRNNSLRAKFVIVNLDKLNAFKDGDVVDAESLAKQNVVKLEDALDYGVKILGGGKIEKKLVVKVPVSKSAEEKIVKAGGKIEQ